MVFQDVPGTRALGEAGLAVFNVESGSRAVPSDGGIVDVNRGSRHSGRSGTSHVRSERHGEGGVISRSSVAVGHHIHTVAGLGSQTRERQGGVRYGL